MNILGFFVSELIGNASDLIIIALIIAGLFLAHRIMLRRQLDLNEERRFSRRLIMLLLVIIGIVVILIVLPVEEETRNGLFTLFGLLLTAVIALSSTTFVANAMAGWMLRAVRSFHPGDFVSVGEHFGRVTGRGLFHVEIQNEDHDLITLPNLYLVSHPVTVVQASGTIVSATVSLGYDNPHSVIESLLTKAAKRARLEEPFVQITELGDFSVTYRVAGFLPEAKQLLTARSNLRAMMLDTLHDGKVEIVSPTFMYQRRTDSEDQVLPPRKRSYWQGAPVVEDNVPEELIFDKAEQAEKLHKLGDMRDKLAAEVKELEAQLKKADPDERIQLERKIVRQRRRSEAIAEIIETYQEDEEAPPKEKQKRPERKGPNKQ